MSSSYICASCRVRLVIERCARLGFHPRRRFSRLTSLRQEGQRVVDRSSYRVKDTTRPRRGKPDPNTQISQTPNNQIRGRYSGQVLGPEQLLEELDERPQQSRHYDTRRLTPGSFECDNGPKSQQHRADNDVPSAIQARTPSAFRVGKSDVSGPLWELRGRFLQPSKTAAEDQSLGSTLKGLLTSAWYQEVDIQGLRKLSKDPSFDSAYRQWTFRIVEQWSKALLEDRTTAHDHKNADSTFKADTSPLQTLKIWFSFSRRDRGLWPHLLWPIARDLAESYVTRDTASNQVPENIITGLKELMGVWHLCMGTAHQRRSAVEDVEEPFLFNDSAAPATWNWAFLPAPTSFAESIPRRAHQRGTRLSLSGVLNFLLPRQRNNFATNSDNVGEEASELCDYESAAVVTLDLLQSIESQRDVTELLRDFEAWMQVMEVAFKHATASRIPGALTQRMMQLDESDQLRQYYQGVVDRSKLNTRRITRGVPLDKSWSGHATVATPTAQDSQALEVTEDSANDFTEPSIVPTKNASATDHFTYLNIKRLGRAIEEQDLRAAEKIWQDVLNFSSRNPGVQLPQNLYEHLIFSFLCLRNLPQGIEIWNRMVKAGHRPTSKTFTVLMRGSQNLRDLSSMEYFWNQMKQAKIQPDATAWSVRIFGLLRKGHTDAGLRALAEMGHEWLAAAKTMYAREQPKTKKSAPQIKASDLLAHFEGAIGGVPRPDIVTMNSAVSGLARNGNELIPKALTWGRSFGIEPNLITYNALLNVSMRHGMADDALSILRRMNQRNIEADSTTWVVLLTAMFEGGFVNELEPREQEARVLEFISSLESASAAAIDKRGYALTIDRLLKDCQNPKAAQAVLEHMASRGVEANAYIYTILMESYLKQSPPDFAAAESLWSSAQSSKGGYGVALDTVFYNRMVEAYAIHHASVGTAQMLAFLSRMESEGKKPSWYVMERVARALSEIGEWERLAQVVDKSRRRVREESGVVTRHGQRGFWQFVISTGMLSHEGITTPEQIMEMAGEDPRQRMESPQRVQRHREMA